MYAFNRNTVYALYRYTVLRFDFAMLAKAQRISYQQQHCHNVSALINACADRIAEAVAERLLESLPTGMVAAQAVADSEPRNGAQNETQHISDRSAGGTSDYIPDEEIPWDFLNQ